VVIVVPTFPHANEPGAGDVVTLAGRALDYEALAAAFVSEMSDQPMARDAHADAHADAPHDPTPAADRKE